MTDLATLERLRERIAGLTGPDREVDALIGEALGWTWTDGAFGYWAEPEDFDYFGFEGGLPYFTEDNNAILALIERVLPEVAYDLSSDVGLNADHWGATLTSQDFCVTGRAPTLPLALCLALVEALIQRARAQEITP